MMMMNNPAEPAAITVKVVRPFTIGAERHDVDAVLEMTKHQAREFIHMGKVCEYTEPEAKPKGKAAAKE